MHTPDRRSCERLDAANPLARLRERFSLPGGVVYFDGNSLGPLPSATARRVAQVVEQEWGRGLIRSWQDAGWWDQPTRLGARLAPLLGAGEDEVVVTDSISVDLMKLVPAAAGLRPQRHLLAVESDCFPTDRYVLERAAGLLGCSVLPIERRDGALASTLAEHGGQVAAVLLGHVDYRSSQRRDLAADTALVHDHGALVIWDLAHSVGAMPITLGDAGADFAVGCTYKFLNGGPGSPAFVYVAREHLERASQPIAGWHGHADAFAFAPDYVPAAGIRRFCTGSPPIIAYAALDAALDVFDGLDLHELERQSRSLADTTLALMAARCPQLELASPRDAASRGSHLAYRHPRAKELVEAMARRGVLADAREPDLVRLGLAPLYLRHVDVFDGIEQMAAALGELG